MLKGTRLQIATHGILIVDVICENYTTADITFAKWCQARHRNGKKLGGAIISHASIRTWDVPVGAEIHHDKSNNSSTETIDGAPY